MTGPISLGHSVKLIPVPELAKILRTSTAATRCLLKRLDVTVAEDYGELGPVISQAAFEAAVFRDLWIRTEGRGKLPLAASRVFQAMAACDFCVLDRAALLKRLRKFVLELVGMQK